MRFAHNRIRGRAIQGKTISCCSDSVSLRNFDGRDLIAASADTNAQSGAAGGVDERIRLLECDLWRFVPIKQRADTVRQRLASLSVVLTDASVVGLVFGRVRAYFMSKVTPWRFIVRLVPA